MSRFNPDVDVDAYLELVRTPGPTIEHGVTKEMAHKILWHMSEPWDENTDSCDMVPGVDYPASVIKNPSHAIEVIQVIAGNNDMPSLRMILDEAIEYGVAKPDPAPAMVIYAVAHMLVNGGGQEAFAKEWMEGFGHNSKLAGSYFKELMDGHASAVFTRQRMLGMTTLLSMLDRRHIQNDIYTASPLEIMFSGLSAKNYAERARDVALVLKTYYPDRLPEIERENGKRIPLETMFWNDFKKELHDGLTAVADAYGTRNEAINAQMGSGMEELFESGRIKVHGPHNAQWEAMALWGEPDIGKRLWQAQDDFYRVLSFHVIEFEPESVAIDKIAFMLARGANINDPIGLHQFDGKTSTVMAMAVAASKPSVVGYLLVNGADPTIVTAHPLTGVEVTAAEMASKMSEDAADEKALSKVEPVGVIMRSHMARQSALDAIKELGDEPRADAGRRAP